MKKISISILILLITAMVFATPQTSTKNNIDKVDEKSDDIITLNDNGYDKEEEIQINSKSLIITGNNNRYTFTGKIDKITIAGKDNDITIEAVNEIAVIGNGNFISWEKTTNGKTKPTIVDKGAYNNIEIRAKKSINKSEH